MSIIEDSEMTQVAENLHQNKIKGGANSFYYRSKIGR